MIEVGYEINVNGCRVVVDDVEKQSPRYPEDGSNVGCDYFRYEVTIYCVTGTSKAAAVCITEGDGKNHEYAFKNFFWMLLKNYKNGKRIYRRKKRLRK